MSVLRVDEILADYFTKKDEQTRARLTDDDEKSSKDGTHLDHKHKSKSKKKRKKKNKKKHKRAQAYEEDSDSRRSVGRNDKKKHKHRHSERKHSSARESSLENSKENGNKCENLSDTSFGTCTDITEEKNKNSPQISGCTPEQKEFPMSNPSTKDIHELNLSIESLKKNYIPIEIAKEKQLSIKTPPVPEGDYSLGICKNSSEIVQNLSKFIEVDKPNQPDAADVPLTETLKKVLEIPDVLEEGELVEEEKEECNDNANEAIDYTNVKENIDKIDDTNAKENEISKRKNQKHKSKRKIRSEERNHSRSPDRNHSRSYYGKHRKRKSRGDSKDMGDTTSHHSGKRRRSRSTSMDRSFSYPSHRSPSIERSPEPYRSSGKRVKDLRERIDKKRLLEIARKNVLEMIESGTLPHGVPVTNLHPQQLVSIKAGGKSVEELTEFCKALAEKHKVYSSSSSDEDRGVPPGSDDEDAPFLHHPFKVKEAQPMIRMNIRNAVQLPLRTTAEKSADSQKLRQQFPVSSGNQHRTKELEWVPVEKNDKKSAASKKAPTTITKTVQLAITAAPLEVAVVLPPAVIPVVEAPPPEPLDSVFPAAPVIVPDISAIVAERVHAMRKLRDNPHDVQALTKMFHAQQQMQNWAESKIQPGQFGHSITNRLLTPEELTGPYPVWARKDQLISAAPVQGGIGMHLLKKMGWNPGEGLGKNKEGSLVPLMLDVKTDKKGLVSNTEAQKNIRPVVAKVAHDLSGKHPVSALMELCSKRKWGAPDYTLLDENGPDHRKNFLFKVRVKGVDYQPSVSSASKKQAKALAATVCLQAIGLLPRDLSNPL